MPSLERQVKRSQERRQKALAKEPEVQFLLGLVYGIYQADKVGDEEKGRELFDVLRDYGRKIEAHQKKVVD